MAIPLAITIVGAVLGGIGGMSSLSPPFGRMLQYGQNWLFPNQILDPQSLVLALQRGYISIDFYYSQMQFLGYNEENAATYWGVNRPWLTAYELITLYRRGELDRQTFITRINELGIPEQMADHLLKITEYYPSVADIIRFAVREVYTPRIVEKYGMKEDLPADYIEAGKKVGLSEEQAANFWAAHWELPSPNQAYEMFHRGFITEDELEQVMKTLDIMPFWRDKMKAIAYNPLTRVDVRRMYGLGVLDENQVYQSYLNIGYSPDDANYMTQFTILYESDELSGITKTQILNAYIDNIISEDDMIEMLGQLGLTENVIQFWANQAVYDKTVSVAKKYTTILRESYLEGGITLQEVRQKLLDRDIPNTYIEQVLEDIQLQNTLKTTQPSVEKLESWLEAGIIEENQFKRYMSQKGYSAEHILNYLTEITIDRGLISRRFLDIEVYKKWFITGVIEYSVCEQTLLDMGYIREEVYIMMKEFDDEKFEYEKNLAAGSESN